MLQLENKHPPNFNRTFQALGKLNNQFQTYRSYLGVHFFGGVLSGTQHIEQSVPH